MFASARLSIDAIDPDNFDVALVEGRERLSTPYRFDVTATARDEEGIVLWQTIGRRARLHVEIHGVARAWSGVVASVRALGRVQEVAARGGSRPVYRVRIVEATWLLRHRVTSRIFRDLGIPDVIRAVLAEHRITAVHGPRQGVRNTGSLTPPADVAAPLRSPSFTVTATPLAVVSIYGWCDAARRGGAPPPRAAARSPRAACLARSHGSCASARLASTLRANTNLVEVEWQVT